MIFNTNYIHEKLSAVMGAFMSMIVSDANSIFARIIIGTSVGVLVWIITKTLTWIKDVIVVRLDKIEKKMSKMDNKIVTAMDSLSDKIDEKLP